MEIVNETLIGIGIGRATVGCFYNSTSLILRSTGHHSKSHEYNVAFWLCKHSCAVARIASHRLPTDLQRLCHQLKHEMPQSSIVLNGRFLNNQHHNVAGGQKIKSSLHCIILLKLCLHFIRRSVSCLVSQVSLIDDGLCPLIGEWRSGGR